jgi:hypothetical protein
MTFLRNGDDSGGRLGILEGCEHSEIRLISMSEINLSTHYRPSRLVNLPDFAFSFNFISACRLSCRLHDLEPARSKGLQRPSFGLVFVGSNLIMKIINAITHSFFFFFFLLVSRQVACSFSDS